MESPPPQYVAYPRPGGSSGDERAAGVYFDTIGEAFALMFRNAKVYVGAGGIAFGVFVVAYVIFMVGMLATLPRASSQTSDDLSGFIFTMIGLYIIYFSIMGMVGMFCTGISECVIEEKDTGTTSFATLFSPFRRFIPVMIATWLSGLLAGIGFCFCFAPGLYLLGIFAFAPVIAIQENLGAIAAMKKSAEMLRGQGWMMGLLLMVMLLLASVGSSILIGLIITLPPYYIVIGLHYRYFRGPKNSNFQPPASFSSGTSQPNL